MATQHAALTAALKRHAKAMAPTRRVVSTMKTNQRLGLIVKGNSTRTDLIPKIEVGLAVMSLASRTRVVLGIFESPEQAVLFGRTGQVLYGRVTLADIMAEENPRSGFFRHLNEQHVTCLLESQLLKTDINRTLYQISIFSLGWSVEVEAPVVPVMEIVEGRKFR
jgi:hypothetical protein